MRIGDTLVEDTFAEAFGMKYARLTLTAFDEFWLDAAVSEFTGYSSSVIACDAEAGLDRLLSEDETPDGRKGASVLVFGFSGDALAKAVANRTGQCVMTCPSTAAYNGMVEPADLIPLGKIVRFFGDGFQKSKKIGDRRFWRVPVMDGEFLVEERVGIAQGVAGGNIILQAVDQPAGLAAARRGADAVRQCEGAIAPFPGGVARSGSKVGSRYKALPASTADAYCPTLRGRVESKLHADANCAYEIVIDGVDEDTVARAMGRAIHAAAGDGIVAIGAGNYGGKLGKFHFHLRQIVQNPAASPS